MIQRMSMDNRSVKKNESDISKSSLREDLGGRTLVTNPDINREGTSAIFSPPSGESEGTWLRADEVNELLSAVPSRIVRWGITVIFIIMVLVLSLSFFIQYPDVLSATTTITTIHPPVTLLAKTSGKINEITVTNNQLVKKGETLLVIESNADYNSILKIDSLLNVSQSGLTGNHSTSFLSSFEIAVGEERSSGEGLGELTPVFLSLLKAYNDYKLQVEINPQQKEIIIIEKQLSEYRLLQDKYRNQENNFQEELALTEKDFNRIKTLFQSNTVSTKEFEDKNREYLSAKRNYENIKIANITNKLTIHNLEKNRLQLQMQAYREKEKYAQDLAQSIQIVKSQIDTWKQTYLLRSPIEGKVSLFNYWVRNQNLKQGEEVMSIVPMEEQQMIAKLFLPVHNSGKLKEGQTVNIKLNNYLFQEYGMLKGYIKTISPMPKNEMYAVEVALPEQLKTTYNKQLNYKQEMQGTADIITEDLSVFDRVFYRFRKMVMR